MDRYEYSTDSTTNHHKHSHRLTKNFISSGLPGVVLFFPEVWKLHLAGHNVLMCLLGVVLFAACAIPFELLVARRLRKKIYGVKRQDFWISLIVMLMVAAAFFLLYLRRVLGLL